MKWLLLILCSSTFLLAHDLNVTWQKDGQAVILRSAYAGTEECSYASVEIFDPSGSATEFQNGRTDARGYFSFVPDRAGNWRAVVDDEMGHRVEVDIELADLSSSVTVASSQPLWQKTLTGLAVILGFTGFLYGWKARRQS